MLSSRQHCKNGWWTRRVKYLLPRPPYADYLRVSRLTYVSGKLRMAYGKIASTGVHIPLSENDSLKTPLRAGRDIISSKAAAWLRSIGGAWWYTNTARSMPRRSGRRILTNTCVSRKVRDSPLFESRRKGRLKRNTRRSRHRARKESGGNGPPHR